MGSCVSLSVGALSNKSSLSWLDQLRQQQLENPSNFSLAHDIGLAHYWQAKRQENPDRRIEH